MPIISGFITYVNSPLFVRGVVWLLIAGNKQCNVGVSGKLVNQISNVCTHSYIPPEKLM